MGKVAVDHLTILTEVTTVSKEATIAAQCSKCMIMKTHTAMM